MKTLTLTQRRNRFRDERRREARQRRIVAVFNQKVPVGTPVVVELDDGTKLETIIREPATMLGERPAVAVVWLEGITGCYLLSRVSTPGIELFPRHYQKATRHRRRAERLRKASQCTETTPK